MIPEKIERNIAKFKDEAPDDIFVLGRNLYQSSNEAYNIINYFESLQTNLAKFPQDVACHLLSGMAYEIFFGCDGKLRKVFKTHRHYKNVLITLREEEYEVSSDFIYGQLEQYRQQVFWMPSKPLDLEVHIEKSDTWVHEEMYRITSIYTDGINIMYEIDGKDFYDSENDYRYDDVGISMEDCKSKLLERVAGTKRDVSISFVNDSGDKCDDVEMCWSNNFWLIRYIN
jgi:hypothetical protein